MKYKMSVAELLTLLQKERINTWFDLGIFIDRFRETKPLPSIVCDRTYDQFREKIIDGGLAFITFQYSVDGVTIEVDKYTKIFRANLKNVPIHYIAGKFYPESFKIIHPGVKKFEMPEISGFNDWPLYRSFFFTKLERGSKEYNDLIIKFWNEVLIIIEKLGNYIVHNNINLLYLINVCSNPGNISLTLACVFISEYLGIPVINNNHDFYWEGGNSEVDKQEKELKDGPRDFFFMNSHLGEVFSLIEVLFPWESRSWINANINADQIHHIIKYKGHNPANVVELGTAVDTGEFVNISKRRKINAYNQFEKVLSRYNTTLVGYSVKDILKNNLVDIENPEPILIGSKTLKIENFLTENIIFLQPTRIITRKRIEIGFRLVKRLFNNPNFIDRMRNTPNLKITLLVTGPIALGHFDYFKKLIKRFDQLLDILDVNLRHKVFLAFLFSELDKESFKQKFKEPVGIPELYNIASLVLLPSKTEGRGLPIIEAAACGTPIFCRRYFPQTVYSEVIGENLPEIDRLKVIEFDGKKVTSKHAEKIIDRVLFPHLYTHEVIHNKTAVKQRFSLESLNKNIENILKILYHQILSNKTSIEKTDVFIGWYKKMVNFHNEDLETILDTTNRQYMPGFGKLTFMLHLKSLIDPSAFRVEEHYIRGYIHDFARKLVDDYARRKRYPQDAVLDFYNAVDNIFHIRKGEVSIRHDHSFSYRHRNKNYYPYQDFTLQELTGLVDMLFQEYINPKSKSPVDESSHFFTDLDLALLQLTSGTYLAIDNRKELIKKLQTNIPIGIFPGNYIKYELEFFALQAVRSRLKMKIENELSEKIILDNKHCLAPIYVFAEERMFGNRFNKKEIEEYIRRGHEPELKLLYEKGILNIVNSKQICVGVHFPQMGEEALHVLREIKENKGFIIANREEAAVMTDITEIDCFHIGKAQHPLTANIMGIPEQSGFIQFVPAGIRTTLAYPTPVQTSKSFDRLMKGQVFRNLTRKIGEEELFEIIKNDAREKGSPINYVLDNIDKNDSIQQKVNYEFISGLYEDKNPWNGVIAKVNTSSKEDHWQFQILSNKERTMPVTRFIEEFESQTQKKAMIAWNGGYILNPELVGKLGLPESYIGSQLGLLISDGITISPPLFNKPALLVKKDGSLMIKEVNISKGFKIHYENTTIQFKAEHYNNKAPGNEPVFYDLMYPEENIVSKDRVIVRLAGNTIKEIIEPGTGDTTPIFPVGLTLSFPASAFPEIFYGPDIELRMEIAEFNDVLHAVEAGPMLVESGNVCIDMEHEGWKTKNSIRTQAARLDYTDMRGPKIAAGILKNGDLIVMVVNGRIRESVGATHYDMAEILKKQGAVNAMGFDPGGSSTLVVGTEAVNISPYNKEYERNIYSLPPEPRAVSNAVIGYIDK